MSESLCLHLVFIVLFLILLVVSFTPSTTIPVLIRYKYYKAWSKPLPVAKIAEAKRNLILAIHSLHDLQISFKRFVSSFNDQQYFRYHVGRITDKMDSYLKNFKVVNKIEQVQPFFLKKYFDENCGGCLHMSCFRVCVCVCVEREREREIVS